VTVRKEGEQQVSAMYDQAIPNPPTLTFDSYLNGESIVQQDLVVWASCGLLHLPHAEDVPVTATPGHSASILIRPFNFYDADPSLDLPQAKWASPSEGLVAYDGANATALSCAPRYDVVPFNGTIVQA
jgi:Cu2+-containing amine oxidase